MHYPDLTSSFHEDHPGGSYRSREPAVYVGWLAPEDSHEFTTGAAPDGFVEALQWAVRHKVNCGPFHDGMAHRGSHWCGMCLGEDFSHAPGGNYTVTIPGPERDYYVPSLIAHYVGAHQYLPPQEFIEAVLDHWHRHNDIQENQGTRGVIRRILND